MIGHNLNYIALINLYNTLISSNNYTLSFFREVRAVVFVLRESLLETNEEIKSLTNGKEALEKALDHIRKDLNLNQESHDIRQTRPSREKVNNVLVADMSSCITDRMHSC